MTDDTLEKLGLSTLEDISSIILHSHDLPETLTNIVNLVARRMGTDVCSIYLVESDGETLTLHATRGLSRSSVGRVTMKISEGLTGLVIERRGVVAIEDAPQHPRYKYFRESREERYHSFLGVPIMERNNPVGVLVVQTREPRQFRQHETTTLSAIAWQISGIVVNAKLLDSIRVKEEFYQRELARLRTQPAAPERKERKKGKKPVMLAGVPASPGFSWGKIYLISRMDSAKELEIEEVRPQEEVRHNFQLALEKAKIQTLYMEKRVATALSESDAAIFHTHLMIMEDRGFIGKINDLIDQDYGAARAVRETVDHYVAAFAQMDDPYLRERSADMEDIGRRIIMCLDGNDQCRIRLREERIVIADDILPSDMATMDHEKILGIITEKGDINAHASIMARSLGIPAVVGVQGLLKHLSLRDEVIVDGNSGHIYINPDGKVRGEYERLQREFGEKRKELDELRDVPAATADGHWVHLRANIGLVSDIRVALENGAEGVGLYRTEFPYMTRSSFPKRHEQVNLYRRILEGFPGMPVNIRTLDIGGDKSLPYFPAPQEDNPFMGWRSIRVSLECRDIFKEQLAAILMAAPFGQASMMFPMISGIDELREVRSVLEEVKGELAAEGVEFRQDVRMGIMIELPAAVQTAEILIKEVDYFSIGTNDLIQYTLAADRNNARVRKYYDPYHPAVLHSIKRVADAASAAGKVCSVCGEMASEPMNALLLLGMGIREFSLAAPSIPVVKQKIMSITLDDARRVAEEALAAESGSQVREILARVRQQLNL